MDKNCCNPYCFKGKNYKDNFGKNHNKKKRKEKKSCRETL